MDASDFLHQAGFNPPETTYTKEDRRGPEYGHFVVRVVERNVFKVTYVSNEAGTLYTITIEGAANFVSWAAENT